ncbi:MAG TPA: DUF3857 domain-containing protein, partial [Chitinophagaceae bacterium]|nr:DUF3857 domain-containing protein [Chitinophagaceae bacterium]
FELQGDGKARLYKKYAITVLNEAGDRHAYLVEYYDKFHSVRSIEGTLYDAAGKKIKTLKKGDVRDLTGDGGDAMVDDNRYKLHSFYYKTYPYTVEYEVEMQHNGTLFFPNWTPHEGQKFAVQQSRFTVICPSDYKLRYKPLNCKVEPVITEKSGRKNYVWELTGLEPIEQEYASKSWIDLCPKVVIGASDFKMQNYAGNMDTWQDFGKFVYSLKQGRDQLPEDIKKKVADLTNGVNDPRQKVNRLYEFMQANTRYIGIQLGIGGWQPFDAAYVATKRYGDCKALSNYMYSLLKEAGINSYYTLIRADNEDKQIMTDFPSQQFNHVILCVPVEKDTIWLECTSQTVPAGYLGFGTYDRPVLLVDENGGKLVRTRKYSMKDNLQSRNIRATLDAEGNLTASVRTLYSGLQQDNLHDLVHGLSKEKLMEFLKENLDLATYDVAKFDYRQQKSALPSMDESLDLTIAHYASVSGKRIFIQPNILTRHRAKLTTDKERKYPIIMNYEYLDVDTVHIKLPQGYKPEAMPADVEVSSMFGKYTSKVRLNGNELTYYRSIEKQSGEFPASAWPELVKFYEQMYKADRSRVVLVKE